MAKEKTFGVAAPDVTGSKGQPHTCGGAVSVRVRGLDLRYICSNCGDVTEWQIAEMKTLSCQNEED